ncbi:EcsC family protein [Aquibacillus halophilus]|uniref:EcsC family protein n=1 Tax=Aquibacillus halophilus TaxID=930132 RepID=A0A6A8DM94_9BACI|nr:EcsC family protein [Aquibacillus halophilus]MRH44137.1 EcsC family protein [Aquibacillus halophilus]
MSESTYEQKALNEAQRFQRSLQKKSSIVKRTSKSIQSKINNRVPEKVHRVVTESVKKMIELALTSSNYIHPIDVQTDWIFEEKENQVNQRLKQYKKTAMLEGAGTGAGGIFLGIADFPLLLSIKMKFLFDTARIYGYDVDKYEERMYVLHIFMLAFSSDEKRGDVLTTLIDWEKEKDVLKEVDWKMLQLEYRDSIDFVKMMQLIPGFGAIVGAFANRKLLDQLGDTAIQIYRLRILS